MCALGVYTQRETMRVCAVQSVHLYAEIETACGTVCLDRLSDKTHSTAGELTH